MLTLCLYQVSNNQLQYFISYRHQIENYQFHAATIIYFTFYEKHLNKIANISIIMTFY
jgi:hypothetical protein